MDIYPTTSNVQSIPKCTLFENFLAQILFGFLQIFLFFSDYSTSKSIYFSYFVYYLLILIIIHLSFCLTDSIFIPFDMNTYVISAVLFCL